MFAISFQTAKRFCTTTWFSRIVMQVLLAHPGMTDRASHKKIIGIDRHPRLPRAVPGAGRPGHRQARRLGPPPKTDPATTTRFSQAGRATYVRDISLVIEAAHRDGEAAPPRRARAFPCTVIVWWAGQQRQGPFSLRPFREITFPNRCISSRPTIKIRRTSA